MTIQGLAICPYCKGKHKTKAAFNKCKKRYGKLEWTKDGQKVWK